MTESTEQRTERLRRACRDHGQEHLWAFWDQLAPPQREEFLTDLERVPFEQLPALRPIIAGDAAAERMHPIDPPESVQRPADAHATAAARRGAELLRQGAVAAFTVAGGQGTRLGFDGPKGAFPVSPIRNKTLFQLFAEQVLAARRTYGAPIRWYIMTSDANDAETRAFFEKHGRFGLPADDVVFFRQGSMPAFQPDGRIVLGQPHRLALAPDGHGGSLLALARRGALADMAGLGIEYISYFQVDNPLVRCLDPYFIGLHAERGSEMSTKVTPKASDDEKVGVLARCGGVLRVLEYSDLPADLIAARNADGSRRFDAGNLAIHVLSRTFVERLTADAARFRLPWHRAVKKVPFIDAATGRRIEPATPNAVKLEAFVFDALPLAADPLVLVVDRAEEFSPVKNATGVDSVATSKHDQSQRAARWLAAAGAAIPRRADGSFDGAFEISPLRAAEAADLLSGAPLPREIGATAYLE